jgi:hypothetical protein
MIVSDTNLFLVKDCFGSYKELTAGRVNAPHYSGTSINLDAQMSRRHEPIKNRKVTRENRIFGVLKVGVFHTVSIAGIGADCKGVCATFSTGTRAADLGIKKGEHIAPRFFMQT